MAFTLSLAAVALAALLWAEVRDRQWGRWAFKPVAAACYIALALQLDATASSYGSLLLAGLLLCWLGDVFLIPAHPTAFLLGLGSFLLGHVFYILALLQLPLDTAVMLWMLAPVVLFAVSSLRWLWPHVPGNMQLPVFAYLAVISAMMLTATGSFGTPAAPWIIVGGWGFAFSDLAVARNQFVSKHFGNRLWGLPLYFGSQMLLAWSISLA